MNKWLKENGHGITSAFSPIPLPTTNPSENSISPPAKQNRNPTLGYHLCSHHPCASNHASHLGQPPSLIPALPASMSAPLCLLSAWSQRDAVKTKSRARAPLLPILLLKSRCSCQPSAIPAGGSCVPLPLSSTIWAGTRELMGWALACPSSKAPCESSWCPFPSQRADSPPS